LLDDVAFVGPEEARMPTHALEPHRPIDLVERPARRGGAVKP